MTEARIASCVLAALGLAACGRAPSEDGAALSALQGRIAALEQRKTLVADSNDIERLQAAFGYYFDRGLWDEVATCSPRTARSRSRRDGVYVGKARVREYLYALGGGHAGLARRAAQRAPASDAGDHARGRRLDARKRGGAASCSKATSAAMRSGAKGPYENEYVKEAGVWKIKALHWYQALYVPYAGGWQTNPDPTQGKLVSDALPPDRPPSVDYKTWPETYIPPFSFPNPVARYVPASEQGGAR